MGLTISDIAKLAGVSTATVSRVLNDSGFVREETREAITRIIREQNYTPSELQRKRKAGQKKNPPQRSWNFATVWSGGLAASAGMTAQAIMQGLSEAAGKYGATINVEFVSKAEQGRPGFLNRRKLDGLFLNGDFSGDFLREIQDFPAVWLLQSGGGGRGDRVQPDHSHAGLISCEYFLRKGCRKLCCVSSSGFDSFYRYWKTREQAFLNAAEIYGVEAEVLRMDCRDDINAPVDVQQKAARGIVNRIRSMERLPDGIFVANTLGGVLYAELAAAGIVPGRDIGMVAGDREVCGGYCNPEPVRIDIHAGKIGGVAVEAMIRRLREPELPELTYVLKPSLVIPRGAL